MSIATRAVTFLMTLVALAMVIAMLTDGRLRRADVPVVAMPSDDLIAHSETNFEPDAQAQPWRGCGYRAFR